MFAISRTARFVPVSSQIRGLKEVVWSGRKIALPAGTSHPTVDKYKRLFSSKSYGRELPYRMLTIDGGGIKGIIPGIVMKHMEDYTGKPIHQLFDGMAGTSTGGILALSASAPQEPGSKKHRFTADEIVSIYTDPKISRKIFALKDIIPAVSGFFYTKYSVKGLEDVLKERFGDLELKDLLTDMLITSVDINTRIPKLFTRDKARVRPAENYLIRQVARSTSAAPTFFDPIKLDHSSTLDNGHLVDGGIVVNNPTLCKVFDVFKKNIPFQNMICVSLGTGEYRPFLNTTAYGKLSFAAEMFGVISEASSQLVHHDTQLLLGDNYHRFQTSLTKDIQLDDTRDTAIKELVNVGKILVNDRRREIERVCDKLVEVSEKRKRSESSWNETNWLPSH